MGGLLLLEIEEVKEAQEVKPELQYVDDSAAAFRAAAGHFVAAARDAVAARGVFRVALAGGSTPKGMYALLAADPLLRNAVAWDKIQFYWGDERHVPPTHSDSNYKMATDAMLSKVPVAPSQIHRVLSENPDAAAAAAAYEREVLEGFGGAPGSVPRFDLVLLGMGPDGHTASLFPGTKALEETQKLVVSNWVGKFYTQRITMTARLLNNAAFDLFLVCGDDKAPALKAVMEGPYEPVQLPSQLIQPASGSLVWMVDQKAAATLAKAAPA